MMMASEKKTLCTRDTLLECSLLKAYKKSCNQLSLTHSYRKENIYNCMVVLRKDGDFNGQ